MTSFGGLDLHKDYCQATVLDSEGNKVMERKFLNSMEALDTFLENLDPDTRLVLESCGMYEPLYDRIEARGFGVTLAHPKKVKAIADSKIKNDKIDATTLAHLLRANLIPASYVPCKEVREMRSLVRHRASMVRLRSQVKHRVHGLLLKKGIRHEFSDLFGKAGLDFLNRLDLEYSDRFALDNYLSTLNTLNEKIGLSEATIDGVVEANPYIKRLTSLSGIGRYSALLLASEIADIKRFPSAKKLCSYAGLVPSLNESGLRRKLGSITKEGSSSMRWILVQAAHKAVASDPRLSRFYEHLKRKKGSQKAIVAVARKMLTYIYIMLTEGKSYQELYVSRLGGHA